MMDHRPQHYAEKLTRFREYAEALEEERRKIEVFQRELPLCLQLVTQAIESCRHQMQSGFYSDCEETSSEDRGPVLEEFIPIKRTSEDTELQQRQENHEQSNNDRLAIKKRDWLMSVSLWNQEEDPFAKEKSGQKSMVVEMKKKGAFHPFCRDKSSPAIGALPPPASVVPTVAASSSTAETNGGEEKEGDQSQRKTRRCWSPELHRRFLHALQQLGGSHVATPKQIRELMKVDGLTNDEVKSHLQKYRLHTRRPSAAMQSSNAQHTQFVVVGGIWVPPELAPAAAQSTEATQIYAPVAALPPQLQQKKTERSPTGPLHDDGEEHSVGDDVNSSHTPASSSSRTTSPSLF